MPRRRLVIDAVSQVVYNLLLEFAKKKVEARGRLAKRPLAKRPLASFFNEN